MSFALNEIAKEFGGLAAVGVSEIGNRKVLEDLIATDPLKNRHLKIVHYDSPDWRGVDVGFYTILLGLFIQKAVRMLSHTKEPWPKELSTLLFVQEIFYLLKDELQTKKLQLW
jgi:hypothetical protein